MTTLRKTFKKNGVLTSPYSVKLSSDDAVYGVKRTDNDAVVVADATAMTEESTGVYTATWTDPALGLTYEYSIEVVVASGDAANYFVDTMEGASTSAGTLAEAKNHCRVDSDLTIDDTLIAALMVAANAYCENQTRRSFITQTRTEYLTTFPSVIKLPFPPLQSITSIVYVDPDGTEQTLSSAVYDVFPEDEPGEVRLANAQSWPSVRGDHNGITITYVAGYGDTAADVPGAIRQAILLLICHWYEHREEVVLGVTPTSIPSGVDALLSPYMLWEAV